MRCFELRADIARNTRGVPVRNVISLAENETVKSIIGVNSLKRPDLYLVLATKNASIKKVQMNKLSSLITESGQIRRGGLIVMKVKNDDEVVSAKNCKEDDDVMMVTENGKSIRILNGFNLRIKRGDRIGIIGRNGSGKTTFLKLILNDIRADQGSIKINKNMEFSYFDQNRIDLKPNDSLKHFMIPNGGDYIDVRGKMRHIYGYLKDFMFDPRVCMESISTLSGGQKNRLKLAKILANPKSCLILDEPTNDLDMETLDMIQEILIGYEGTL